MSALSKQEGGSHYQGKIQMIEFIMANNISYPEGCAMKYLYRHKNKNGLEDLKKAIHYIELIMELEYDYTEDRS